MTDIATHNDRIATIGMDLGKRSFHLIGMDGRLRPPPDTVGGWSCAAQIAHATIAGA